MNSTIWTSWCSQLERSAEFQSFAIPKRVATPIFSRYDPGMKYGSHVDNAFMGGPSGVRSDLSVTLFLSPPDSYDGGELVVEMALGEQPIKLDAGEGSLYPSSFVQLSRRAGDSRCRPLCGRHLGAKRRR